jgi:TonB-dependent receptor
MYRPLTVLIALFLGFSALAQQGTITGTITAPEAGVVQPMPFVNVALKGTTTGATTDLDGRYTFQAAPGVYVLVVSFVGYEPVERPVTVEAGETVTVDVEMRTQGVDIKEFEVVEKADRERETVQLVERRASNDLVQSMGSQELRKKGASDVAEGVQKIVGLSTIGGRYLVVRGLNDRYNSAYLNGLPLPSPDPDTKVPPLDIFPTDIVESISVTKGFTPELYGDFSGGAVDILTKRATGKPTLKISLGGGMNTASTFKDFRSYNGGSTDFWGRDDGTRDIPPGVLGQGSTINGEVLPFPTNFSPTFGTAAPDLNFSLFGGTRLKVSETISINLAATASYRNENRYRDGRVKIINTDNTPLIDYTSESWSFNTQGSALGALSVDLGKRHTVGITALMVNLSSDEHRLTYGEHFDYEDNVYARRYTFRQNALFTGQVFGRHAFGMQDRLTVDWSASSSKASAQEPDRRQLVYLYQPGDSEQEYRFNAIDRLENHRWYSDLGENETAARGGVSYRLLQKETEEGFQPVLVIRTGGQLKIKSRDFGFDIFTYNLQNINAAYPNGLDANTPDAYLNNAAYSTNLFSINNVTGPEADHDIRQEIQAAYLSGEWDVVPGKLRLMGGARLEVGDQRIVYRKQSDSFFQPRRVASINSTDLLPYAAVKVDLNKRDVLRASASQTISRPGFREMAPFEYTEFFAGTKNVGDPNLQNGTNYNADVRFERYPSAGELLAVGVFGKRLVDPIEKVSLATASGQLQSFRNTGEAHVMGIELEVVRNLGRTLGKDSTVWNDLSLGMNLSLLYSQLTIGSALDNGDGAAIVLTNDQRPLQGAAPYLVNVDLSYSRPITSTVNGTATVAYNVFGPRVFAAGANGLGDQYELPVNTVNLILRADVGEHWQMNLTFRNLLDARYRIEQETPNGASLVNDFRLGTSIGLGVSYLLR